MAPVVATAIINEQIDQLNGQMNELVLVDAAMLQLEAIVNEASIHVKAVVEMCQFANTKMAQAAADDSNDVPWAEWHDCFIANFCQNMECPFFGASQPGDTY